jgi:uncharacterized lipoprotein YmbA
MANPTPLPKCLTYCIIAITTLLLTACRTSKPADFYILTPMTALSKKSSRTNYTIGVGPIELAEYLQKPQILFRKAHNQIILSEYHRWAEPLKSNIQAVIAKNIVASRRSWHAVNYPWEASEKINLQLEANITHFDTSENGDSTLDIQWTIRQAKTGKVIKRSRNSYHQHVTNIKDYNAIIAVMSSNLNRASRDMIKDMSHH